MTESSIYIGTSGWSYPKGEGTWKGHFYPSGKVDELEFYSQYFKTVEINSTFYRPANPGYAYNWVKKTPEGFLFAVKLWQKFTHPRMYEEATGREADISCQDVDVFLSGIEPLLKYQKLGALLAQFPPSFINNSEGRQMLGAVMRTFGKYSLAIEMRHRSWSDDEVTAALMKEHNVAWVQIDEPKFKTSIARDLPQTSDLTYFRFHGRNYENWWKGNNETRYQYLYSDAELQKLSTDIAGRAETSRLTLAYFNNHWQGWAPRNALGLMKTLNLFADQEEDKID